MTVEPQGPTKGPPTPSTEQIANRLLETKVKDVVEHFAHGKEDLFSRQIEALKEQRAKETKNPEMLSHLDAAITAIQNAGLCLYLIAHQLAEL